MMKRNRKDAAVHWTTVQVDFKTHKYASLAALKESLISYFTPNLAFSCGKEYIVPNESLSPLLSTFSCISSSFIVMYVVKLLSLSPPIHSYVGGGADHSFFSALYMCIRSLEKCCKNVVPSTTLTIQRRSTIVWASDSPNLWVVSRCGTYRKYGWYSSGSCKSGGNTWFR